jgi:pimeloyl-ACP methyl ester carboxylesterase
MSEMKAIAFREHGASGPVIIALHGGPAACGSAAPMARGLARRFRVLEPWQRGSGAEPLTVARHVEDLHRLIVSHCAGARPSIVGESWGAMLALAYAAAHPEAISRIAIVGCGTWDAASREKIGETLRERMGDEIRRELDLLQHSCGDAEERMRRTYELTMPLYSYDPLPAEPEEAFPPFDAKAHTETWDDMLRLQREGVYPAAFAAIKAPVLMIHGSYDPHPGRMIRDSLLPFIPRLEYRELERCGHSPWTERHVRADFFAALEEWLSR